MANKFSISAVEEKDEKGNDIVKFYVCSNGTIIKGFASQNEAENFIRASEEDDPELEQEQLDESSGMSM